jgi:hypothetical protein
MEIELVPDPDPGDPAARAALTALSQEALDRDVRPAGIDGAWRRAGLAEAVDRGPSRNGVGVPHAARRPALVPPTSG